MTLPAPTIDPWEDMMPAPDAFTETQLKITSNGVLKAMRRGWTRVTQSDAGPFTILGGSVPGDPQPKIVHASWLLATTAPVPDLGLPRLRLLITDETFEAARFEARRGDWAELLRAVDRPRLEVLYSLQLHPRSGWFAMTNPAAREAAQAALVITRKAVEAGGVQVVNPLAEFDSASTG